MKTDSIPHSAFRPGRGRRGPANSARRLRILAAGLLGLLLSIPAAAYSGSPGAFSICHGFGCRFEESVSITDKEWNQIKAFFNSTARTPAAEREQIRKAVGWLDVIVGRHTPIHLNKDQNELPARTEPVSVNAGTPERMARYVGQLDCIDESLNLTTYLRLMERAGLFRHHRVVERAHRKSAFDQHYAGQIEEIKSGERWVLDSWVYGYGSLPYLEASSEWHDLPFRAVTSFPAPGDG